MAHKVVIGILALWLWLSMPVWSADSAPPISLTEAQQRLQAIATAMESVRFCARPGCRFEQIAVQVRPGSEGEYVGSIDAVLGRPADFEDRGHYNFVLRQGRWHLSGGEEISDVSSVFFEGDEYEIFSNYSNRSRRDKLQNANATLRVGYKDLYFRVLDQGGER